MHIVFCFYVELDKGKTGVLKQITLFNKINTYITIITIRLLKLPTKFKFFIPIQIV